MPLPPFPSEEVLSSLERFPYPEGYQYEFKENLIGQEKLVSTVCALLNNQGGYILIGVRDCDLAICGLPKSATEKKVDMFLLILDTIYHQSLIVKETGEPLDVESIRVTRFSFNNRRLLLITVQPKGEEKVQASNYKVPATKLIREMELQRHLFTQQKKMQEEYKELFEGLQEEIRTGMSKVEALSEELEWTKSKLAEKILADKERAEQTLAQPRRGLLCLLCSLSW
jgi:predicted HTH transcriptional regulator